VKTVFPRGYYKLEEMDGTELKGTYTGNRLKKFIYKKDAFIPVDPGSENELDVMNSSDESESWNEELIISQKTKKTIIKAQKSTMGLY
jgi:hypothetical protein